MNKGCEETEREREREKEREREQRGEKSRELQAWSFGLLGAQVEVV